MRLHILETPILNPFKKKKFSCIHLKHVFFKSSNIKTRALPSATIIHHYSAIITQKVEGKPHLHKTRGCRKSGLSTHHLECRGCHLTSETWRTSLVEGTQVKHRWDATHARLFAHRVSGQWLGIRCWAQSKDRSFHGYRRQKLAGWVPWTEGQPRGAARDLSRLETREMIQGKGKPGTCHGWSFLSSLLLFLFSRSSFLTFLLSVVGVIEDLNTALHKPRPCLVVLNT